MRADVASMPHAAWMVFLGTLINRFGTFLIPFLVLYLTRQGHSIAAAGAAIAAYGAGAFGSSLIGGYLADHLGRRNTIALSMFSSAGLIVALAYATQFRFIVVLAALVGFSAELYRPASSALLADLVPPEQQVTAFAVYRLAINVGAAVGPAVGGFVADRSFFALFVADAVTSAGFGLLALIALPHGVRSDRSTEKRGEATRSVINDRGFMLFLLAMFLGGLVYMQFTVTLPLHVRDSGFSNAVYGGLLSLNGIVVVVLELPIVAYTQRAKTMRAVSLGLLLLGAGYGMYAFSATIPLMAAAVLVWTLGEIVQAPVATAFIALRSPDHLRGRYQAAAGLIFSSAAIVAALLGAWVYAASPNTLWVACFVTAAAAAALVLRVPDEKLTTDH